MGKETTLITIDTSVIMAACTCIVTVAGAVAVIYKMTRKIMNTEKIGGIEECLKRDKKRLDKQDEVLGELSADMKQLLSAVDALLEHAKTGNSTNELSRVHSEFKKHLYEK